MTIFNQKESQYSHTKNKYGEDIVKVRVRSHKIQVFLIGNNPQISINWGDGNTDIANEPKLYEHSYKNYGVYGLRIQGSFDTDGYITVYNNELADDAIQAVANLNKNQQSIVFQNIKDEYVEPSTDTDTGTDTGTDTNTGTDTGTDTNTGTDATILVDGDIYAWGHNEYSQLGDGTTENRTTPTPVSHPFGRTWQSISASDYHQPDSIGHTLAIDTDGTLYTWGNNIFGQLGNGTTENRTTPTPIPHPLGYEKTWQSVEAGTSHTLAIDTDGHLYAWGRNSQGQLGDGTTTTRFTPIPVSHPLGDVKTWRSVSAASNHTLAIDIDGNLYAWGNNSSYQLGDGTTTTRFTPTLISHPLGKTWRSVTAGWAHTLAIDSDGYLYAWGLNSQGQLGDGTTTIRTTPTPISHPWTLGGVRTWRSITVGIRNTLAIDTDGALYAWGLNDYGQLGDGGATTRTRPTLISHPQGKTWQSVEGGTYYTLAIDTDGDLYAWGQNNTGQLGDGTTTTRYTPTPVSHSSEKTWQLIAAGGYHSIAISS